MCERERGRLEEERGSGCEMLEHTLTIEPSKYSLMIGRSLRKIKNKKLEKQQTIHSHHTHLVQPKCLRYLKKREIKGEEKEEWGMSRLEG